jgi:tRNA G18 (ribose-2'-O)-methylase SpoU
MMYSTSSSFSEEEEQKEEKKVRIVSSAENATAKRIAKLRTSKTFREKEKSVVIVGSTVLREILQAGALGASEEKDEKKKKTIRVKSLLFAMEKKTSRDGESYDDDSKTTTTRDELRRDIAAADIAGGEEAKKRTEYYATAKVMKKLAGVENADGIDLVAELEMPEIREVTEFMMQDKRSNGKSGARIEKVLCLDGVQDPGNVGTLLRTAEAFGFDAVGLGPKTCNPFNDKCVRSSKGTAFRMQMFTWKTNEEFFEGLVNGGTFELKRNVLAAMLAGENCAEVARELDDGNNSNNKVCLVLGSEGQGVSEEIASSIRAVTIPTPGVTESLNVAVAGGILMSSLTVKM